MKLSASLLLLVLFGSLISQPQRTRSDPSSDREAALRALNEGAANLAELDKGHARTMATQEKISQLVADHVKKSGAFISSLQNGGRSQSQLMQSAKNMQKEEMSFNLQYLQLQSQMQSENRQYTAISNIMKTKHDTVKNSISNIR